MSCNVLIKTLYKKSGHHCLSIQLCCVLPSKILSPPIKASSRAPSLLKMFFQTCGEVSVTGLLESIAPYIFLHGRASQEVLLLLTSSVPANTVPYFFLFFLVGGLIWGFFCLLDFFYLNLFSAQPLDNRKYNELQWWWRVQASREHLKTTLLEKKCFFSMQFHMHFAANTNDSKDGRGLGFIVWVPCLA